MDFRNLTIKPEYRSNRNNIIREFYIPVLENAKEYKRAVGFFSSTALIEISKGLSGLVRNGGKIFLVASPKLSIEDIEAINTGYNIRNKIIERAILNSFDYHENLYDKERLNLLAYLVSNGTLEIKIAFTKDEKGLGMFHEKMGLIYDCSGNVIAFTGSMNETATAYIHNYESIDVYKSWSSEEITTPRVKTKESFFQSIWDDMENNINVIRFPEVAREKLLSYAQSMIDLDIDKKEFIDNEESESAVASEFICEEQTNYGNNLNNQEDINIINENKGTIYFPKLPSENILHDYQQLAIEEWEKRGYIGIFDMATGTGKTYTALGATERLYKEKMNKLGVFIVCPYQHLVDQWVEDIKLFNMNPIIGYSSSPQKKWRKKLQDTVISFNHGIINHFCFISTNATYSSKFVQEIIKKYILDSVLIVIDEAHNFGADHLSNTLNDNFKFRIGLSATIERHND
jgi:hypothetical protein